MTFVLIIVLRITTSAGVAAISVPGYQTIEECKFAAEIVAKAPDGAKIGAAALCIPGPSKGIPDEHASR